MSQSNVERLPKRSNVPGVISLVIAGLAIVVLLNFFLGIFHFTDGDGLIALAVSCIAGCMGVVIASFGYKGKNKLSLVGIILNGLLIAFPFLYLILGTVFFGV